MAAPLAMKPWVIQRWQAEGKGRLGSRQGTTSADLSIRSPRRRGPRHQSRNGVDQGLPQKDAPPERGL